MNTVRISQAIRDIDTNTRALKWLEQYGHNLSDRNSATVMITLHFAGSCVGAQEAKAVLESFTEIEMARIVDIAIRNCRNTIELAQNAIIEEASRAEKT